ncbi:MAG: hypothetical protein R3C12_18045 [Planctomycetaceae bacterium]
MPGIYKVFTCLAGYRNVLRGIVLASGLVCVALGAPVIRGEEPLLSPEPSHCVSLS